MRSITPILFGLLCSALAAFAQPAQAPLQTFTTGGAATGGFHTSTNIPQHFSSFGQPMVIPRTGSTVNGGGMMMASEIMFTADTQPPAVSNQQPASGSTNVPLNVDFALTFNEAIARGSGDILLRNSNSVVATYSSTSSSHSVSGNTLLLEGPLLSPSTVYHVIIPAGAIRDLAGNSFAGYSDATGWQVTTGTLSDATNPSISSTIPANNATAVATNSSLSITFSETIKKGSGSLSIKRSSDNSLVQQFSVNDPAITFSGSTLTIVPSSLPANSAVYVQADNGFVLDLSGNLFAGISSTTVWNFSTAPGPDTTPPAIFSISPTDGQTGVPVGTSLVITFSKPVQKGIGNITVIKAPTTVVGTVNVTSSSVVVSGSTATISLANNLAVSSDYYINIDNGAFKDLLNNNFAGIANSTAWNFTTGNDQSAPTLGGNSSSTSVTLNQTATISVTILEDASTVTGVIAEYRTLGTTTGWTPITLGLAGSLWNGTTNASFSKESGVEYRITATNSVGLSATFGPFLIPLTVVGDGVTIAYSSFGRKKESLRIVAVPLVLEHNTAADVFNDDLGAPNEKKWRLARWTGSSTKQDYTGTIVAGSGYWLIVKEDPKHVIGSGPGTAVNATSTSAYDVALLAGWTQIGNPYNFPIKWSDVQGDNQAATLGNLVTYRGKFEVGDGLRATEGGFIYSVRALTIKVYPKKSSTVVRTGELPELRNPLDDPNWQVDLVLNQGEQQNLVSGFGMRANASNGFDVYDMVSLPRFDEYLEVNHSKKINGDHYTMDIVPTADNFTWEFNVASSDSKEEIDFQWDNTHFGSNGKQLVLFDVDLQRPVDMRLNPGYNFKPGRTNNFKVIFGDREFVEEQTNVNRLVVHQVYPNPAEADLTVALGLPQDSWTSVELHDLFGRRVATLFEGQLERGHHDVHCQRASGDEVGMYLVVVRAQNQVAATRVILK